MQSLSALMPLLDRYDPATVQGRDLGIERAGLENERLRQALSQTDALFGPSLEEKQLALAAAQQAYEQQGAVNPLLLQQLQGQVDLSSQMAPLQVGRAQSGLEAAQMSLGQQEAINPLLLQQLGQNIDLAGQLGPLQVEAAQLANRGEGLAQSFMPGEASMRNALMGAQVGQIEEQTSLMGSDSALRQAAAATQLENAQRERSLITQQLLQYLAQSNPELTLDPQVAQGMFPGLQARAPFMDRFQEFQGALSDPRVAANMLQNDPQLLALAQQTDPEILTRLTMGGDVSAFRNKVAPEVEQGITNEQMRDALLQMFLGQGSDISTLMGPWMEQETARAKRWNPMDSLTRRGL